MNKLFYYLFLTASLITALVTSKIALAEPWVDTSDIYLKANIQLLADQGYITTPTTTYPLMWADISRDLRKVKAHQLKNSNLYAYQYVKNQLRLAKQNKTIIKLSLASKEDRFNSFGDKNRTKDLIQSQSTYMTERWAFNFSPGFSNGKKRQGQAEESSDEEVQRVYDGSYIAATFGNWVFSYGKQDRWFGPAWDSSLLFSNNARPITAFSLSRRSATPITLPFSVIEIPWTITTFMGSTENDRTVEDALIWSMRVNFKPLNNLEIGLTRLAMWGGTGQSQSLSSFTDVVLGKTDCLLSEAACLTLANAGDNESQHANQQFGADFRLSFNLLSTPLALYGSYLSQKDEAELDWKTISEKATQLGIDTNINLFNVSTTAYIEHSDTVISCTDDSTVNNCFNEHSFYQTGFRYKGRSINHQYDNDAKTTVLGFISQFNNDFQLTNKFKFLELNTDNSDKNTTNKYIGNPLTNIAEEITMFSTNLQYSYQNWRFNIDADISRSTFENNVDSDNASNIRFTIEHIL